MKESSLALSWECLEGPSLAAAPHVERGAPVSLGRGFEEAVGPWVGTRGEGPLPALIDTPLLSPEIVDQPGLDIFGQVFNQWKSKECVCPNCSRSIAASRFAPHLEKCLGMGRNSSRIANRR